ncbi:unnamed protein product [Strongylus vulgaris]|uniref:Uncharacterized protein n=1 Tax=Strongylus vulgaris TaxID=40348 RepID=A0A3P7IEX4_STRVU|nr:unnamed protein product [Strongylus vulgaris]
MEWRSNFPRNKKNYWRNSPAYSLQRVSAKIARCRPCKGHW